MTQFEKEEYSFKSNKENCANATEMLSRLDLDSSICLKSTHANRNNNRFECDVFKMYMHRPQKLSHLNAADFHRDYKLRNWVNQRNTTKI